MTGLARTALALCWASTDDRWYPVAASPSRRTVPEQAEGCCCPTLSELTFELPGTGEGRGHVLQIPPPRPECRCQHGGKLLVVGEVEVAAHGVPTYARGVDKQRNDQLSE